MATTVQNSVDVGGLIQNMLDTGFSTEACIGELLDDSIGAGAKAIVIHLNSKQDTVYVSDDACGMNDTKLELAHTLHKRSDATDSRQGRFGIGNKHAKVHLTQHQFATRTISKSDVGSNYHDHLYEIKIDWPTAVKDGVYRNTAHPSSYEGGCIWTEYAIDKNNTGTVTIIPCAKPIFKELKEKFVEPNGKNRPTMKNSLFYFLGVHYHEYLMKGGLSLSVKIDGKEYKVDPIDPLAWDVLPSKNKKVYELTVMRKDSEIRTYLSDKKGYYRYLTSNKNAKKTYDSKGYAPIGQMTLSGAFSYTWSEQDTICAKYALVKSAQERYIQMGGMYMQRNEKIISKFDVLKPGKGDMDKQAHTILCRYRVRFGSNLDGFFKVMVNKSKMDSDLIHESIMTMLNKLQKEFMFEQFTVNPPPAKETDVEYEDDSEEEDVKPKTIVEKLNQLIFPPRQNTDTPATPKNEIVQTPPPSEDELVVEPILLQKLAEAPLVEDEEDEEEADDVEYTPVVQQETPAFMAVNNSVIRIPETIRSVPKSEKDLVMLFTSIHKKYTSVMLQQKAGKASSVTAAGNAATYNVLLEIDKLLSKLK